MATRFELRHHFLRDESIRCLADEAVLLGQPLRGHDRVGVRRLDQPGAALQKMSRRGLFAFQIHSGGPMEVRFKDVKLEVLGAR